MRRSMVTLAAATFAAALPLGMAMAAETGSMEQGGMGHQAAQTTTQQMSDSYLASNWIGKELKNGQGDEVGRLHSVLIDKQGKVTYGIVSQGGAFGMGGKSYAVPWERFAVSNDGKLMLDVKKDQVATEFSAFEPKELEREHGSMMREQKKTPESGGMGHESE